MLLTMRCNTCGKNTPHTEDIVFDKESATVWHCLYCGEERRPDGGNSFVLAGDPRKGKPGSSA